jgi:hypothetical protein
LAMDKPVLASPSVCQTFGKQLPHGIISCASPREYLSALDFNTSLPQGIRSAARRRFCWSSNLQVLSEDLEAKLLNTSVHQS